MQTAVAYCFFSGSCGAEEELDAPPEDAPEEGCAAESLLEEPEELGEDGEPLALGVELEPEELGVLLLPPDAEPDLAGSLAPLVDELDEPGLEPGVEEAAPDDGLLALPPTDDEPELEPGELGGVEAELLLPLLPPLVLPADFWPLSWPQAARPNAIATATARVESFMKPPWLG